MSGRISYNNRMSLESRSVPDRVAVVGAGHVGAACAYALLISGAASEILLVDRNHRLAEGEAMDLSHGLPFVRPSVVRAVPLEQVHDVDLVIVAAGANQKPGETRLDLVGRNVRVIEETVPALARTCPDAVFLIITNPVDVLTSAALRFSGLPPSQVIGSGTVLDSARFRAALARHCGVASRNVHAHVVGEHGDSEVAVWSGAAIGGIRLLENCPACGSSGCDPTVRQAITDEVRTAAYQILERKGATYFGIGLSARVIAEAVLRDERAVLTVSTRSGGEDPVAYSLPRIVGRRGVLGTLAISLSPEEAERLERSRDVLRESLRGLGIS
jgi:L-lactate dehydrogenase